MQVIRPVGREAAAKKYDILSALMAYGLAGDQHRQRLVMRFMSLITTRYNWQRNELTMGQREIARLWCVDERTVKRDMARLRSLGWVTVKRQGARGRVAVLGFDLERIMLDTRAVWENIGPDFVERAGGAPPPEIDRKVVPFRRTEAPPAGTVWAAMRGLLAAEDQAVFDAWIAGLGDGGISDGRLTLVAPTGFHASYVRTHLMRRIEIVARRVEPGLHSISVETAGS
ncbi:hypothetical protein [Paracoccus sp. SCSIO 75233]|uniref:hypothetical protein n=1 Tax=Paracoccus sp. SCSIO 75233 TaxID=3017782 RepID=UPI0022F009F3|nr:hypothetical protein [Paracoccus sp. SCSIO 75233]WBU55226.1 hypothetical protein PAF12_18035 [Paracoccus sp. SCSIO 75233]